MCSEIFIVSRKFQSTLLQEERRRFLARIFTEKNFNPRSYKRSDFCSVCSANNSIISIHAPTRGATLNGFAIKIRDLLISIHAPTRGATYCCGCDVRNVQFQSTLLQEERRQKCTIILILICNNYCIVSIKSHQHYNNYFM